MMARQVGGGRGRSAGEVGRWSFAPPETRYVAWDVMERTDPVAKTGVVSLTSSLGLVGRIADQHLRVVLRLLSPARSPAPDCGLRPRPVAQPQERGDLGAEVLPALNASHQMLATMTCRRSIPAVLSGGMLRIDERCGSSTRRARRSCTGGRRARGHRRRCGRCRSRRRPAVHAAPGCALPAGAQCRR